MATVQMISVRAMGWKKFNEMGVERTNLRSKDAVRDVRGLP